MCATCGCGDEHVHGDDDGHIHAHSPDRLHSHDHPHRHDQDHATGNRIELEARILVKNDALAQHNRGWLAGREILALNLLGAPGAGKTTLLERTIADLRGEARLLVIEGDQATANDAERIRAAGAPVVQVNTGTGCHLDAAMVARGLTELRPGPGAAVLIENVGNLVCPALFDLGERAKVVIFSVTEGEDKPVKYPHMFRAADLVIFNKIDLLPHLDFAVARARDNLRAVNHHALCIALSARTGEGMAEWYAWLRCQRQAVRGAMLA
jgi:hydrogenase nickel incorporation protein HypB